MNQPLQRLSGHTAPPAPLALADDPLSVDRVVNTELCSARYYTSTGDVDNRAYLGSTRIGALNILHFESQGLPRCERRPDHIRADNLDQFVLCLPISARILMRHRGLATEIAPGEFLLVSTRKPIQGAMFALGADKNAAARFVRIPGPLLRERILDADEYGNQAVPIRRGAGTLMCKLLEEALAEAPFFSLDDSHQIATLLIDSISHALLSSTSPPAPRLQAAAGDHVLQRAKAFIDANLSDPALNAGQVARHCRVSVRYLHTVFKPSGETLAGHIRERRLLQCREALRDGRLRHRTIIDIALQWGFEDPSHFSRCYKQRFGRTPREERQGLPPPQRR